MLLASAGWPGWAFDQSGLGIIHALAGPLSARYALPTACVSACCCPTAWPSTCPRWAIERAVLLRALDMAPDLSDAAVIDRIKAWLQGLGLPGSLREVSTVDASRITAADLAEMGEAAARMAMLPNNPRPATAAD